MSTKMKRFWVKLHIDTLNDPRMARLESRLWRRAVELLLLAGRQDDGGRLPPLEEMAWHLRMEPEELRLDLASLVEAGVIREQGQGWAFIGFEDQQALPGAERMRRFRARHGDAVGDTEGDAESDAHNDTSGDADGEVECDAECDAESDDGRDAGAAACRSSSPSALRSLSGSDSPPRGGERVQGEGRGPASPQEAMRHPDIRVYSQVTGGRIPASDQYQAIIDAVRYLRREKGLDDRGLVAYLRPFWKSWGERKRQDGRPYGGGNISWLTEWALNDSMPEKTANEMTVQERTESFFGKS